MSSLYNQRLLHDIHELSSHPYPYITFHSYEDNINKACLVLTPPGLPKIHLTVYFGSNYPVKAPKISIQTQFAHPNVFGDYICASILNTAEGYTPAYTLKGIAIQILSFFNSDTIQQGDNGAIVNIKKFQKRRGNQLEPRFRCEKCGFSNAPMTDVAPTPQSQSRRRRRNPATPSSSSNVTDGLQNIQIGSSGKATPLKQCLSSMPPEILIRICDCLESEDLVVFMRSWDKIGGANGIVTKYDLIRTRELQCFALKQGFGKAKLGVGVHIDRQGRVGRFESEFDLLSDRAFADFNIRKSVQGLPFEYWLPLAISRRHYEQIKDQLLPALGQLGAEAGLPSPRPAQVLYAFMNDVVVKLSTQAAATVTTSYDIHGDGLNSSLHHASEKAIESYYHLFHLLLCLACTDETVVRTANNTLTQFLQGTTSKDAVPNLGHLLIMVLISDFDMDDTLTIALIREAVTRNVVWMLDRRGADMPELSYMEADTISHYRLAKTFEASRTSYRLLMFFNLFRRSVDRGSGKNRKTVRMLRDEIFDRHGAPPRGAAARLARDVKALGDVKGFPAFLQIMNKSPPRASEFTTFLRDCVEASVRKGYSVWAYSQPQALELRKLKEPNVMVRDEKDVKDAWRRGGAGGRGVGIGDASGRGRSFFPNVGRGGGGERGRGGGGQWRGRGGG